MTCSPSALFVNVSLTVMSLSLSFVETFAYCDALAASVKSVVLEVSVFDLQDDSDRIKAILTITSKIFLEFLNLFFIFTTSFTSCLFETCFDVFTD